MGEVNEAPAEQDRGWVFEQGETLQSLLNFIEGEVREGKWSFGTPETDRQVRIGPHFRGTGFPLWLRW